MTHTPRTILYRLADGRYVCECQTCGEHCDPTHHKPAAEDWRKAHIKEATR